MKPALPEILPGDVLLYRPPPLKAGLFSWVLGLLISIKTWTRVSHCEVYGGAGMSYASRNGLGVACYPLRTEGLGYVLRPYGRLKFLPALGWFYREANGQKYDWRGLLTFTRLRSQGVRDRMFCSEFVCRFFSEGFKIDLFEPSWCCDRVSPSMILSSPKLRVVWSDGWKV